MGTISGRWRERLASLVTTDRGPIEIPSEVFRSSVKATRGLPLAEALLLVVVGFTLDDLNLLRVPGYVLGALGAVLALSVGRLVHGRNLARRIAVHHPDDVQQVLDAARLRNALAAIGAVVIFVAWLVFFSSGVPPWRL